MGRHPRPRGRKIRPSCSLLQRQRTPDQGAAFAPPAQEGAFKQRLLIEEWNLHGAAKTTAHHLQETEAAPDPTDRATAEEEHTPAPEEKAAEGDKDDDDDEDDDEDDLAAVHLDAPARPSTLTGGKAAPDRASPPTTRTGAPAVPDLPVRPTTLVGSPEAPDFAPPPSTLSDEPEAAPPAGTEAGSATRPARARKVN